MEFILVEESGDVLRPWEFSKHYLDSEHTVIDVMKMNLSVNSFLTYEFQIWSSLLFRDLMLTFRPMIAAWAISNRDANFDEFTLDEDESSLLSETEVDSLKGTLLSLAERVRNGERKDYAKEELPLLTETGFSIKVDFRILLSIMHTFSIHAPKYFEIMKSQILPQIGLTEDEYNMMIKFDMYERVSLSQSEFNMLESGEFPTVGCYHTVGGYPAANIMAQFIRQHNSTIKNGLWNMFNDNPTELLTKNCKLTVPVFGYLDDSAYEGMFKTRTCWFAQMDKSSSTSWSCILDGVVKNMDPKEFLNNLPCKNNCNKCRITETMIARVKGLDSNPPCPILLEAPNIVHYRQKTYNSTSEVMNKWIQAIPAISDNPNNELRKEYEKLNKEIV